MGLFQRKNDRIIGHKQNTEKESVFPMYQPEDHSKANTRTASHGDAADYGIGDLIKLFHSLPKQNFDAEISAVVRTIASFDINIGELINDVNNQESLAKKRMKVLELEIELFKAKIKNRQREMELLRMGLAEMGKSKDCLQQGLKRISEENNSFAQRRLKKRTAKLKSIPELKNPLPIAEKIKIVTSKEIDQINAKGKVRSIRNKFKKRLAGK